MKNLLRLSMIPTVLLLIQVQPAVAQDLNYARKIIQELCSETYQGRGYVNDGVNKAADYLAAEFSALKLRKFRDSYIQTYSFPVNTHPYPISCETDGLPLKTGEDFLVSAGSPSVSGSFRLLHFNTRDTTEQELLYKKIERGFDEDEALVLHFSGQRNNKFIDTCVVLQHMPKLILFTEEKKLTHTIARKIDTYSSLVFIDSAIAGRETIRVSFENKWQTSLGNQNLIGYIKGKRSDSFIVFSAHYDHLGMQGDAMFPGASDNASGSSMILYLAKHFSKSKPACNMVFILFSGEEAGLMGSEFFTANPTFDIQKIKMLVNIDIMGDAKNGITVVNGEVFKAKFDALVKLNATRNYLPEVRIRGKARNSDHYHFSEKGIPSFFIYSMGGAGYYHDVFDKANTLTLANYENVAKLLIDFVHFLK